MKTFLLLLLFVPLIMQGQDLSENITKSTLEFKRLFLVKDFEALTNSASPKLIEHLKTKQDLIFLLTELSKSAESKGVKVTNIEFGSHSEIITFKDQLQCSIPFTLKLEDARKEVIFSAGLALISFDKGDTWTFTFKIEENQLLNNKILDLDPKIHINARLQIINTK